MSVFPESFLKQNGKAAGIGFIAVLVLGMASVAPPVLRGQLNRTVVDIGVEHEKPFALTLEVGVLHESAVAEFYSEASESILISVPSTWVRREVKNAPIHEVTSETPALGFTRWTLPPRAGISFRVPEAPDSLILHNPTGIQMMLNVTQVDLPTETVQEDVILIQGNTVKLW